MVKRYVLSFIPYLLGENGDCFMGTSKAAFLLVPPQLPDPLRKKHADTNAAARGSWYF